MEKSIYKSWKISETNSFFFRSRKRRRSPHLSSGGGGRGRAGTAGIRGRATGATAHAGTAALVLNTTALVVEGSGGDIVGSSGVDTEGQPSKDTIADAVAEESVLVEGVDTLGGGLLGSNRVIGVGGQVLGVGVVGGSKLNGRDEILVEESLADVAGDDVVAEGTVAVLGGVLVDHQVDVGGTGGVVTGEGGLELSDTVGVGLLDTTEEGVVNVGLIGGVTVARGNDTGVDTGGVAVPHLEVDVGDGLAGVDINDLVVNDGVNTLLVLADITTDVLATDVWNSELVYMKSKYNKIVCENLQ
jgi:hypothetical protein